MSRCVRHEACPRCKSGDNLARYEDGSAYCFTPSCGYFEKANGGKMTTVTKKEPRKLYYEGLPSALAKRGISQKDAEFYKVLVNERGDYIYPYYDNNGEIVATKIRRGGEKDFVVTGDYSKATLFGQQLFGTGGKYLTIVEGQDDAIAGYVLSGGFPTVSVKSATSAVNDVLANIEFIESYDKVKIAFDNDEEGRKAAKLVAEKLSPGKAEIITFTKYKDANDYLKARAKAQYNTDWWGSKVFVSEGVRDFGDIFSSFKDRVTAEVIPLPSFFGKAKSMLNGGLVRGEITTIVGDTSIGKGQPKWEKVVTPTGYRAVGEIQVGDYLIGSKGYPVEVIGVYQQGVQKCFKLTLNDGSSVHCDENHLWTWQTEQARFRGNGYKTTSVVDMKKHLDAGYKRAKVMLPDNPVTNFDTAAWYSYAERINPYLLGALIGDGSLHNNFSFSNTEKDVLAKVDFILKNEYEGKLVSIKGCNYRINSTKLRQLLVANGMRVLSISKRVPLEYLTAPRHIRLQLLAGLIDTDGSVTKGTANIEYSTSSEELAYQVKYLVRSLGGTARVVSRNSAYVKDGLRVSCHTSYRVYIKQPKDVMFFFSDKHLSRYKQGRAFARNYVVSIEEVAPEETVCFKVDAEDELYLTNDFIVTHNTTLVNNILRGMLQEESTKILYLGLETTLGELVSKMLSMELGRNIEDNSKYTEEDFTKLEEQFNSISWLNRLKVVDHRGSIDPDELIQKLRNYIVAYECNVCFIDPLNQALPNSENDTVRNFMDSLLKLASQTRCSFILTSHVRKRNSSDPHDISEDDALGSSAVKQVSYNMILATRDKLAETQAERNSIKLVLSKNRRCGNTGDAGWLYYDNDSLTLEEGSDPRGFDEEMK